MKWGRQQAGAAGVARKVELRRQARAGERLRNSGVFLNLPDVGMPDAVWEREVERRVGEAVQKLRVFKEMLRAGKEPPDVHEQARAEAMKVLEEKLGLGDG